MKVLNNKTMVYCLSRNDQTWIYFDIDSLCEDLKMQFEDQEFGNIKNDTYKVFVKQMTEEELDVLGEFEGF